jgi:hypothetical protein
MLRRRWKEFRGFMERSIAPFEGLGTETLILRGPPDP